MKKTILLSISLLALCTACSVESDSVVTASNKEQSAKLNNIQQLAKASLSLTKHFDEFNKSNMEVSELIKSVEDLTKADSFTKEYGSLQTDYSTLSADDISKLIDKDWSVLDNEAYSKEFNLIVLRMVKGSEKLDSYKGEIEKSLMLQTEKNVIYDGLEMSLVAADGGIDDEWRKRKFMGYILATKTKDELKAVVTATVLDIAMRE